MLEGEIGLVMAGNWLPGWSQVSQKCPFLPGVLRLPAVSILSFSRSVAKHGLLRPLHF
jgi:hypothetical protein